MKTDSILIAELHLTANKVVQYPPSINEWIYTIYTKKKSHQSTDPIYNV